MRRGTGHPVSHEDVTEHEAGAVAEEFVGSDSSPSEFCWVPGGSCWARQFRIVLEHLQEPVVIDYFPNPCHEDRLIEVLPPCAGSG